LINDILDLSKIEAGKIELRPESFDLARLVEEVCDIVKPMAAKKRIQIGARIDDEIRQLFLDPAKLKQVLYNYLSNAVKFTPDNGKIRIAACGEGPERFRLEVLDSGIGIAPEDRERLFIEFQQLDEGAGKKYQGTGLGLALTKRIVEAQGGSVGVTSELSAGSTFFAILPRRLEGKQESPLARHSAASGPIAAKPPADGNFSVLVVAEEIKALKIIDATLRPLGYNLICRSADRNGLEAAQTTRLDAVVLDLSQPGNNGLEFLNHLRQTENGANIPVIIWTSKDLTDEETTSLSKLAQSIISKRHGDIRRLVDELRGHLPANPASPPSNAVEPKV
jgi:CheY-like chemotaxis protein